MSPYKIIEFRVYWLLYPQDQAHTMDKRMFLFYEWVNLGKGFSGDSVVKDLPVNSGDVGWIPGSGRFLGEGNGYPLQYSCLENSIDRLSPWHSQRVGHDWVTNTSLFTQTYNCVCTWKKKMTSKLQNLFLRDVIVNWSLKKKRIKGNTMERR